MTYTQTLDYLFSRLPMFQRIGAAAYKANLDNTHKIAELLGNPHKKFKSIHVAGTNGKGSSSHMLAAILQQAGYKTGLYTSPHLIDFRERIKINGKMIPKAKVTEFVKRHKLAFEAIEPSFFEWSVGLAFDYFASEEVDIAVIEVGLGGRLDSTNILNPEICLITNIGYDHMSLLGDTLIKIAGEKAGIIKPKTPVVVSEQQATIYPVFNAKAKETRAPITYANKKYKLIQHAYQNQFLECEFIRIATNETLKLSLDLMGSYQLKNILGVLSAVDELIAKGFMIETTHVISALKNVIKLTGLQGRWQIIQQKPLIITDTGHNVDGMKEILQNIQRYSFHTLHFVIGVVNDKDVESILEILPKNATYYFVKASVPRALESEILQQTALKYKLIGACYNNVADGYAAAKKSAKATDIVFVGGSTFVVSDLLSIS